LTSGKTYNPPVTFQDEEKTMDIFAKCYDNPNLARERDARAMGLYPYFLPLESTEGTEVMVDGRSVLMIGSNNYLGLTTHPKVREATKMAVDQYGTSCTGSRFLNGTLRLHHELEERLANFVGKEACLVFSTGMQANLGAISSLIGPTDYVICDKENHASIVDACRLGFGTFKRFRHNDMKHLETVLKGVPDDAGKLVIVDGLYSMSGEIAPLDKIVAICKQYGARLYVDDAHAVGVLGNGRGSAAHFGLTEQVDLIMGTFSKSFASIGGFVAGDAAIIHYIKHHARSVIFSASLPAHNVMAVIATLDIIENEPEHVEQLWDNTAKMSKGLKDLGFNTGHANSPIIPILIGEDNPTLLAWKMLFERGLYTNPVVSPAVPMGESLLRTSYMATHTSEQLDRALDILAVTGRQLGLIPV
jgi:8-amino-7-oxononanoate synthase